MRVGAPEMVGALEVAGAGFMRGATQGPCQIVVAKGSNTALTGTIFVLLNGCPAQPSLLCPEATLDVLMSASTRKR